MDKRIIRLLASAVVIVGFAAIAHAQAQPSTMPAWLERTDPKADQEKAAAAARLAEEILATKLGNASMRGVTLVDAIKLLRDGTNRQIFVNWKALEVAKVNRNLLVTVDVSNRTLADALDRLLAEVGGDHVRLSYVVEDNVITISSADDFAMNVVTRMYDISRALTEDHTRQEQIQAIFNRVQGIDPLSWKEAGGKVGSIRELAGQLIVTQTPAVQRKIFTELRDGLPADAESHD